MGTFIIVLGLMLVILAMGGIWGMLCGFFIDSIEEPITKPILRAIAAKGKNYVLLFLPVCILFMTFRRAITYLPAWFGLYVMFHFLIGYSTDLTFQWIRFFVVAAGMLKAADVMRTEYYPESKYYHKPGSEADIYRMYRDYDDSL